MVIVLQEKQTHIEVLLMDLEGLQISADVLKFILIIQNKQMWNLSQHVDELNICTEADTSRCDLCPSQHAVRPAASRRSNTEPSTVGHIQTLVSV